MRLTYLVLLSLCAACSSSSAPGGADPTRDAASSDVGDAWTWDDVPWTVVGDDKSGDCQPADAACVADLLQLRYATIDDTLYFDVRFAKAFPRDSGAFEVFAFPNTTAIFGRSVRFSAGKLVAYGADCTTASPSGLKHAGCHWSTTGLPASFKSTWLDDHRFVFSLSLAEVGFSGLTDVYLGVAAAPFTITTTAEFTDRLPDGLLVVGTGVNGLSKVVLPSP